MRKPKDLVGETFNYLTVIEYINKKPGVYWKCKCKCGKEVIVSGNDLKRGHTKSCGCLRKESLNKIADDLTGKRFGNLVVIKSIYEEGKRKRWECLCDCGKITNVTTNDLKTAHSTSCGCIKYADIAGQRFGKLVAIKRTEERDCCGSCIWECRCDCGSIIKVPLRSLKQSHTQSCGCLHKEDLTNKQFGLLKVIEYVYTKNNKRYWKCLCKCGNIIEVPTNSLTSGNTQSCGCISSRGNQQIKKFLQDNNIPFISEYIFKDCLTELGNPMRFDFCILDENKNIQLLIEYDGNIHFGYDAKKYSWNTEESYKCRVARDKIKDDYCLEKGLKLIRINYKENLEQRLEEIFNEL